MKSIVLKYGGTSLGNTSGFLKIYENIKQLLEKHDGEIHISIVVSAIGKTTDNIMNASELAHQRNLEYKSKIKKLLQYHLDFNQELQEIKKSYGQGVEFLNNTFQKLESILQGVYLTNELTKKVIDTLMSFGEKISSQILYYYLQGKDVIPKNNYKFNDLKLINSTQLIITDSNFGNAQVDFETTILQYQHLQKIHDLYSPGKIWIIPGFIASEKSGRITTLGRGGSDYTAAILGYLLDASEVIIYTDVDGIMTADPRVVTNAKSIKTLSYKDMFQLANYGANVLYSPTIIPLYKKNIPITIKNTLNPAFIGTNIVKDKVKHPYKLIAVNSLDICLIKLYGEGLIGRIGVSGKLFSTLSNNNINILFISQSSSEHCIHVGIKPDMLLKVRNSLHHTFQKYLQEDFEIEIQSDIILVTIEISNSNQRLEIFSNIFQMAYLYEIDILANASSDKNICLAIEKTSAITFINLVHDYYFHQNS